MPRTIKFGDRTHVVPDDATDDEIRGILESKSETYKSPITKASETVAPFAGRAAVEALPFAGSFLGPGGTIAGYGAMNALKSLKPELVGEPNVGFGEQAGGMIKELLLNNALPKVLGKIGGLAERVVRNGPAAETALTLSNFPAVREAATKRMSAQLMRRTNTPSAIMEAGAENTSNLFRELEVQAYPSGLAKGAEPSLDSLTAMGKLSDYFGKNKSGQMLRDMQNQVEAGKDVAGSESYKALAGKVLSDITEVRNAKLVAGHEFPRDLAITKLLTSGFKSSEGVVDAAQVLGELAGKNWEIYKEAIPARTLASTKELLNTINEQQTGHKAMDTIIRVSGHKLFYGAAAVGAGLGAHTVTGVAGGVAAGLQITNQMLRKIMQNPETAKLVTKALQTPRAAPEAGLVSEILTRTLQGLSDVAATPEQ